MIILATINDLALFFKVSEKEAIRFLSWLPQESNWQPKPRDQSVKIKTSRINGFEIGSFIRGEDLGVRDIRIYDDCEDNFKSLYEDFKKDSARS